MESKTPGFSAGEKYLSRAQRAGKARTAVLLWLLGVPIPLIALFFIIKSCVGG